MVILIFQWRLAKEMFVALEALNNTQDQACVHIMIAKARHCMLMKVCVHDTTI